MIHGKPFAAATKASHHFVANHHNAELIAQGPHASKIPLWWHQNAIRSHDRFHNNGGDTVSPLNHDGVTQMLKRPLAFLGFVFSMEGRTISIWPQKCTVAAAAVGSTAQRRGSPVSVIAPPVAPW